jgi:hypothetical protein
LKDGSTLVAPVGTAAGMLPVWRSNGMIVSVFWPESIRWAE